MKIRSDTNVWYLLVLIALAVVFIFAGIKYLGRGEITGQQSQPTTDSTTKDSSSAGSAATILPLDQQYAAKGVNSLDQKNYQEAIDYFTKAIAANPAETSYYSLKAQSEVLAGRSDDARTTIEAGLKIDPENELLNSKLDVLNNSNNLAPAGQDTPRL